jgi:cytochrome c-type biogenesis protein
MIDGAFALAFTTGMLATVNPCGFAMLPAYLSFFLGLEGERGSTTASVSRALVVSVAVSAGFMAVFVPLGFLLRAGVDWFMPWARYVSIGIGAALIVLGIAMLRGYRLPWTTPKLERGGRDRTVRSMAVFGVSYAIASLGCTIPTFLSNAVLGVTRDGFVSGALVIATYGLGMGLVLTALTVTLAAARGGLLRVLRGVLRYVDRIAAVVLILAGAYLIYYWAYVSSDAGLRSDRGGGLAREANDLTDEIANWLQRQDAVSVGLLLGAVVAVALAVVVARRDPTRGSE